MQLTQLLLAAFASIALVNAVAVPEPAPSSPLVVPCGCTNDCIIGCAGKSDCICPQYCDPKYECPVTTVRPTLTVKPTSATTLTPIRPTATCGCLNDCIVGCPDLRLCKCADYCDPKYACPTSTKITTTVKPTLTKTVKPTPTPKCGCTNDCFVNCPPGKNCICPLYCDPKYACKLDSRATLVKVTRSISLTPVPTGVPCGCHNDCTIACGKKAGCVCPAYCDPKYSCLT